MAERRTHGFWAGLLTGILLSLAGLLALAWLHPPVPLLPPDVDAGALEAPAGPGQPESAAEPAVPRAEGMLAPTPAKPLIADVPAPEAAPRPEGDPGSASLVPVAKP